MDSMDLGRLDLIFVSHYAFGSVDVTLYRCLRVVLSGSVTLSPWVKT
jgi:hypothetical protein